MVEIKMNTNRIDDVLAIVTRVLESEGYQEKIVDGDCVWSKGDGVMMKMQCFSTAFTEKGILLQAWLKDAITGESSLEGFVAIIPKKKMKAIIEKIRNKILNNNL